MATTEQMSQEEVLERCSHLLSPAHLAAADTNGRALNPPHLQLITSALVEAWRTPNSRTAIIVPFQHGKLLDHETPVWTERGWRRHGDLKENDYVYSPSGRPVRVKAVSPDGVADHEVEFSDGEVIRCHDKHEWYVYNRKRHRWCLMETQELALQELRVPSGGTFRYNMSVPRTLSLIQAPTDLVLHPYVLGAWLGDGCSEKPEISHAGNEWEIVRTIEELGYKCTHRWLHKDTGCYWSKFSGMMSGLTGYQLLGNKHIPDPYLMGSDEQRMELLAGLIDTDGNYSGRRSNQYRFTNTNKRLIDQTAFLARSLGFKVGLQEYEPTTSSSGIEGRKRVYVLVFSPVRRIPCRLPRKQAEKLAEPCRVTVTAVRRCEPKPGRCIEVEGGLYLAGRHLVTTHNSERCSVYFPAWVLLLWPETRIGLTSYEETFASRFGARVRDVVQKYGPDFGIHLRDDTSAKGEWVIAGDESLGIVGGGGMVCKGRGGAFLGRPVDLLIMDDMIKNAEEAQSPTILENLWDWYCTVAYSRLGPTAPIVAVGTRWGPKDLFGRWDEEAKTGGEKFRTITLPAIAEAHDPLGRRLGEALWPDRVPLERLQRVQKKRPRWFRCCWQGKPEEEVGVHFQPSQWARYADVGDSWRVRRGVQWWNYRKVECTILVVVDWARAGKKQSDCTAIVVAAMTPDGYILVLDVLNERLRYEENVPALAKMCRKYRMFVDYSSGQEVQLQMLVASDDDTLSDALAAECRRWRDIPEIKRLPIRSKKKIIRAQAAIIRSQNGLFLFPEPQAPWYDEVADQLAAFTGAEGAEDDIADDFGILGRLADEFSPQEDTQADDYEPVLCDRGFTGGGVWQ